MDMTETRGATMKEANVSFKCGANLVRASLAIDGFLVVEGATVPEIARLLRAAHCACVKLDDGFVFSLPADSKVLASATATRLKQSLATFYLIAECSWSE